MGFRTWLRRQPLGARVGVAALLGFAVPMLWAAVDQHDFANGIGGGIGVAVGAVFVTYVDDRSSAAYATRDLDLDDEHDGGADE